MTQSNILTAASLPKEIQDLILGFTICPRVICLKLEMDLRDTRHGVRRRFTIEQTPPHVAAQVSQRTRKMVLSRGYIEWRVQNSEGQSRMFLWHPEIDIITFPENPSDVEAEHRRVLKRLWIHDSSIVNWLSTFRMQYEGVAAIATRVAIPTTFCHRARWERDWDWVNHDIGFFQALENLIVVVDEKKERAEVAHLRQQGLATSPPGVWSIPGDIDSVSRDNRTLWWNAPQNVWKYLGVPVPSVLVRVVASIDNILTDQSLNIKLRVNPCEYLGM